MFYALRSKGMKPDPAVIANINIHGLQRQRVPQASIQDDPALCSPYRCVANVRGRVFAGFFCLSTFHSLDASVYVIAKMGRMVVAGADSRTTETIDHTKHARGRDRCKIKKCSDGMYFVMSANPLINIKTGIDFSKIAVSACAVAGDARAKADWFDAEAVKAAKQIYRAEREATVVSVSFFGSDMKGAFYFTRSIRYTGGKPYREPVDCPIGCNTWTAGGFHKVIDGRLQDQQFFDRLGLVEGIRKVLTEEITADKTDEIGMPLSILELNGPIETWREPGVCQGVPKK